jgi:hypothetical protein
MALLNFYIFFLVMVLLPLQHPTEAIPATSAAQRNPKTYVVYTAAESSQQSVKFSPVGLYASTTHYLHIRIPIHFKPILDSMDYFKDKILNQVVSNTWTDTIKTLQSHALTTLNSTRNTLEDLMSELPQRQVSLNHRGERFIGIILSLIGICLGTFNGVQIQNLDQKLAQGEKEIALLKDITHLHEDHLNFLDAQTELHDKMFQDLSVDNPSVYLSTYQAVNVAMEDQVEMVRAAISGGLQHRLAPGVVNEEALESVVSYTEQVCKEQNFENLIHHTSDLYQLETSFLYNPDNKTFSTILHIPLVKKEDLLKLYQYMPMPLNTHWTSEHSLAPYVGHQDMIAVKGDGVYKVLAKTDLLGCFQMGDYHFCHGNTILQTDMKSSCLSSIFIADLEASRDNCRFQVVPKKETILQLDSNHFQMFAPHTLNVLEDCKETQRSFQVTNGATVKIQSGCTAYTQDHLLRADEEEEVQLETQEEIKSWAWNVTHLFPNVTHHHFEEALKNLKAKGFKNVDATDLLHQLDIVAATPTWQFFSWAYLAPVGVLVLMLVCITPALVKYCGRKRLGGLGPKMAKVENYVNNSK